MVIGNARGGKFKGIVTDKELMFVKENRLETCVCARLSLFKAEQVMHLLRIARLQCDIVHFSIEYKTQKQYDET